MSADKGAWRVRLTAAAQSDYDEIVLWTLDHFGERQARIYAETIDDALTALKGGSSLVGIRACDDVGPRLFSLHIARKKRKGRHFVLFRVEQRGGTRVIEVLRILHDSMDLARHIPFPPDDSGPEN